MKSFLIGLLLSGLAWAEPGLLKIVTSNTTPGVKAGSFASKPRTVYRFGASLARVEEVDDPVDKVHMVVIRSGSQGWTIDLRNKVGRHSTGLPEVVSVPLLGVGSLANLEFGNEIEFMKSHNVPSRAGVYEYKLPPYRVRLTVKGARPEQLEAFENEKLMMRLHYDQYLTGLPKKPALFQVPAGITINSEG